jgi:thiol-disulfide isomerase/thioredoxin
MQIRRLVLSFVCASLITVVASAQQQTVPPTTRRAAIPAARTAVMPGPPPAPALELLTAGTPAPDFASNDLADKPVRLSDLKGKVVVLDFWATWCGPCMQSLPHTQEVARQFKDQGVTVLAVCTSDTRAKYEEWVKANQAKYADIAFTCDTNDRGSATFDERVSKKLYNVSGIPTQYVIGRDGKVLAALVGYQAGDARLEATLAKAGIKVDSEIVAKGEAQLRPTTRPAGR